MCVWVCQMGNFSCRCWSVAILKTLFFMRSLLKVVVNNNGLAAAWNSLLGFLAPFVQDLARCYEIAWELQLRMGRNHSRGFFFRNAYEDDEIWGGFFGGLDAMLSLILCIHIDVPGSILDVTGGIFFLKRGFLLHLGWRRRCGEGSFAFVTPVCVPKTIVGRLTLVLGMVAPSSVLLFYLVLHLW